MKTKITFFIAVIFFGFMGFSQIPTTDLLYEVLFTDGALTESVSGNLLNRTGVNGLAQPDRFTDPDDAFFIDTDYLTHPDILTGNDVSLSLWLQYQQIGNGNKVIFSDGNINALTEGGTFQLYLDDGKPSVTIRHFAYKGGALSTGFNQFSFSHTKDIRDGNWHHVVIRTRFSKTASATNSNSFSGFSYDVDIIVDNFEENFINSVALTSQPFYSAIDPYNSNTSPITINNNFNGSLPNTSIYEDKVDDIRLYNNSLTNEDVRALATENGFCTAPNFNIVTVDKIDSNFIDLIISQSGNYEFIAVPQGQIPTTTQNGTLLTNPVGETNRVFGLTSGTDYDGYIREICSQNTTAWSGPISFSTREILYVDLNATGANNGTSWTDAYQTLNLALAASVQNDQIHIAQGTYNPDPTITSVSYNFSTVNLEVYGGFDKTEGNRFDRNTALNRTILSGDLLNNDATTLAFQDTSRSDNSNIVAVVSQPNIIIDGLTISGGNTLVTDDNGNGSGLKVLNTGYPLTVNNLIIENNVAMGGGAIYGFNSLPSTFNIKNTIVRNNLARFSPGGYFKSNGSSNSAAAHEIIYENCLIHNNRSDDTQTATGFASVIYVRHGNSNFIINNTTIANNKLFGTGATTNKVVIGVLRINSSQNRAFVNNSIIWGNQTLNNTIPLAIGNLLGNNNFNAREMRFSLDENGGAGLSLQDQVFAVDPLFVDSANQDFQLTDFSAAYNAGSNTLLSTENALDVAGNARIANTTVDIGAFEFQGVGIENAFVDASATGTNDGSSWANAYSDINTALALSPSKDLWIADGVYTPDVSSRNNRIIIAADNHTLYGGFTGVETSLNQRNVKSLETIFSADLNGDDDNLLPLAFNRPDKTDNATGTVVVNGKHVRLFSIVIENGNRNASGAAGLELSAAITSFEFHDGAIRNNITTIGGAGVTQFFNRATNVIWDNVLFEKNLARFGAVMYSSHSVLGSNIRNSFNDCLFVKNETKNNGGTAGNSGVIWFRADLPGTNFSAFNHCTFADNVFNGTSNSETVTLAASNVHGDSRLYVFNSIFDNNRDNNSNLAKALGAFGQPVGQRFVESSMDDDGFSNASGAYTPVGTITGPPNFISPIAGDYRLSSGSPAIDAAVTSTSSFFIDTPSDYGNNSRVFNSVSDLGAYEFNSTLSVEDEILVKNEIKLYPNPTTSILNIKSKQNIEAITIYSILGKEVLNAKNCNKINVSHLSQGLYIIKVITNNTETIKRFIKN